MYDAYLKRFEKAIEPKIIDYDGKDIVVKTNITNQNKSQNSGLKKDKSSEKLGPNISSKEDIVKLVKSKETFLEKDNFSQFSKDNDKTEILNTHISQTQFNLQTEINKNKSINCINDCEVLKQIIKTEKNKNMNLRYQVEDFKRQVEQMDMTIKIQNEDIEKLEKLRETDKRYVTKMENIIKDFNSVKSVNAEKSKFVENEVPRYYYIEHPKEIFSYFNNKYSVNINDKVQIKEELENMASKLDFYEKFTQDIYEASIQKDKLNQSIYSLWKKMASFFAAIECPNDFELYNVKEVLDDYNHANKNLLEILDNKQNEYSYLINKKQEELNMINGELGRLRQELSRMKLDRGIDLKEIQKLECDNKILSLKMAEIEDAIKTPRKRKDMDYTKIYKMVTSNDYEKNSKISLEKNIKSVTSNLNEINSNNKLSLNSKASRKQLEMTKNQALINKSLEKIESVLDMNDKTNQGFFNQLSKTVKK